jgi:hypothetical protein
MDAETLRALADRAQITDLMYRYCRAVDRLDVPLGHSIWHDNGWADYGPDVYQGPGKGVIDLICARHRHALYHSHQVSNILIDLNGDQAGSEAYVIATLRVRRDQQLMQIGVWTRHIDQWSRRSGRWGLDKRLAIRDFDEIRAVTEMQPHHAATRDRDDPSYAVRGGLI